MAPAKANANASADHRAPRRRRRKPTYYVRKAECEALRQEIAVLQGTLETLKAGTAGFQQRALMRSVATREALLCQSAEIARAHASIQTMAIAHSHQQVDRLDSYIHLPRDPRERVRMLQHAMNEKLNVAMRLMLEHRQFLDLSRPYRQQEDVVMPNGDCRMTSSEVVHFPSATSVQEAFQELEYFLHHQEFSVAEMLGIIAVREEGESSGKWTSQHRLISTVGDGIEIDTNIAVLTRYFDRSELLDEPHGICVVDYINADDLQPYDPERRIRNEVSAALLVTMGPPPPSDVGPPSVVMTRLGCSRLRRPAFPLGANDEALVREGIGRWCEVMVRVIRERLEWRAASRPVPLSKTLLTVNM